VFERYTEPARQVVVLATEECRTRGHDVIGTEHLLLGLLAEKRGMAARVLETRGVTLEGARDQVPASARELEPTATGVVVATMVPFTPAAKEALELSADEARNLGHGLIGTEHVLLGLTSGSDEAFGLVLAAVGTDPEEIRRDAIAAFSGPNPI
jgi:ATP-dependent Clp protease ATP-binding subunit ClpC